MNRMSVLLVVLVGLVVVKEASGQTSCKCGTYAKCLTDGTCACRPGYSGNATFNCHHPGRSYYCGIANDPVATLYGGQVSSIKIPASVCMTQVTTYRYGGGQCKFGLSAWTKQYGAKHYISGMEFMLTQIISGVQYVDRYQVTGRVDDVGNYEWEVRHFINKDRWDIYKMNKNSRRALFKNVHNCRIFFVKTLANFLLVNIRCCRIQFALRPHNPLDEATTPGSWVTIPKRTKPDDIKALPQNVCGSVTPHDPPIEDLTKDLGFKHKYQYMTYAGLAYGVPVNYPGSFKDLALLQQTLIFCNKFKRSRFMTRADFVFTFGRLIKCLGPKIMDLTYDIARGFCLADGKSCINAINTIRQRCPRLVNVKPKVRRFMKNGCV